MPGNTHTPQNTDAPRPARRQPIEISDDSLPNTPDADQTARPQPRFNTNAERSLVGRAARSASPQQPSTDKNPPKSRIEISAGTRMEGQVRDCELFCVSGSFEGEADAKLVQIGHGGSFKGSVRAENAEISGELDGELVVSGNLHIGKTGSVSGKISYAQLSVDAGGTIQGELMLASSQNSASHSKLRSRPQSLGAPRRESSFPRPERRPLASHERRPSPSLNSNNPPSLNSSHSSSPGSARSSSSGSARSSSPGSEHSKENHPSQRRTASS